MQRQSIRYLASMFINATDITPHLTTYIKLNEIFGDDIILGTMQEITPAGMQNRIKFDSPTHKMHVTIGMNRVNIERITQNVSEGIGTFEDFSHLCESLFSQFVEKFMKSANRLSFVSEDIIIDIAEEELEGFASKLFILPSVYSINKPSEWTCRLANKQTREVNEKQEGFNVVTNISRVNGEINNTGEMELFEGLKIEIDINTVAECTEFRFKDEDIRDLYTRAPVWRNEVSLSIDTHLGI